MSFPNTSNQRAVRWLGITAITAGLFFGTLGVAGAATSQKSTSHRSTSHSTSSDAASRHHGPADSAPGGVVQAVTATSLTVTSRDGVTSTYVINTATTVVSPAGPTTLADVTNGVHVHVASSAGVASVIYLEPNSHRDRVDREVGQHLAGQVVAVNDTTVIVADRDGFWRTVNISSATTFTNLGRDTTQSTVTVGSFVMARGSVNVDHVSLDATDVQIAETAPKGEFGSPNGHR